MDDAIYSQLDFWVGDWVVESEGEEVGRNRIEKILDGCAVLERWTGAAGGEGRSLFYVDNESRWQQVWVTQWATMPGGTKEKALVASEDPASVRFESRITHDGKTWLDRTTLTKLGDGRVRQLIEISRDGGATWETTFDALYRRSK